MRLRRDGLTWHAAGEDLVVLDLEGSSYLKLNESGRVLWDLLAEPQTEDQLVEALIERFGIGRERASTDVAVFVTELRRRDLIED